MSFLEDSEQDFREILGGEFATKVEFLDLGWETTGIFDNTYDSIGLTEQGQEVVEKSAKITIYYKDAPGEIKEKTNVKIYKSKTSEEFDEWKVFDVQDESEGNALIRLKK
jgi:hypothetical protein